MQEKLAAELRRIRGVKGFSLRDVERETKISNAYLSQLETGKIDTPAPNVLHKLAGIYGVPYESLMKLAGYLPSVAPSRAARPPVTALGAALMSAELTEEEEGKVADFVEFLRAQRRKK